MREPISRNSIGTNAQPRWTSYVCGLRSILRVPINSNWQHTVRDFATGSITVPGIFQAGSHHLHSQHSKGDRDERKDYLSREAKTEFLSTIHRLASGR